jgi:hypothetical protein
MFPRKRRVFSSDAERAETRRKQEYDSRQRRKNRKDPKEPEGKPEGKPAISFLVYVPPYIPLEPKALEGSMEAMEAIKATPEPDTRYDHLAKGPRRTGQNGRPVKHRSREAALAAKKESDHQRYLRRREQRRREKQALSESAQAVPECPKQSTTTNKSQNMQPTISDRLQPPLNKSNVNMQTVENVQKHH